MSLFSDIRAVLSTKRQQKQRQEEKLHHPKIPVRGHYPTNFFLLTGAIAILGVLLWVGSTWEYHWYRTDTGYLVFAISYVSTTVEQYHPKAKLKHMTQKVVISQRRSPIRLTVYDEDRDTVLYDAIHRPRGIREDAAIMFYEEIPWVGKVSVTLEETAFPEKRQQLQHIVVSPGETVVVLTEDNTLKVVGSTFPESTR